MNEFLEKLLNKLTLKDVCGQLLCYDIYEKDDPEEVEEIIKRIKPGGIFVSNMSAEKIKLYTDMVNKYTKVPVIVSADVENGPENGVKGGGFLPYPMAWGACNDEELIREAGRITARICRKNGIHWTFAPVVDLNLNFRSPETNIRAVSDDPDAVIRIAGAYADGIRSEGFMTTGTKHFPGAGTDERNSHFCTTVNPLSKEEWFDTYGKVYRAMIEKGAESIMVGHYTVPSLQPKEENSCPCILSKTLMTDILKGEFGFKGCIVSDAMSMIGACASTVPERLAVEFLKAGGDMVLFPEPTDVNNIIDAVKSGEISNNRLIDAFSRVIELKRKAKLFDEKLTLPVVSDGELAKISQQIADRSVTVVRDYKNIIPKGLKKGDKVLGVIVAEPYWHAEVDEKSYEPFREQLAKVGVYVDYLINPKHKKIQEIMGNYDMVVALCNMSSKNYHGGTMRIGWYNVMTFWRAYIIRHPRMIFASLGDPYKLFDFPYLEEYINVYSDTAESQKALAKVLSGEIKATGKNPVNFDGYFKREI